MKILTTTVARIIFAIPFIMFGLGHFMNAEQMTSMIPQWMPAPMILNYISGAALILGGVAIITKKMAKIACLLLALMLLIFIVTMHLPNMMGTDEMMKQMGMISMLKDFGTMGAALFFAGYFAWEEEQAGSGSSGGSES